MQFNEILWEEPTVQSLVDDYWSLITLCRWQAPIPLLLLEEALIGDMPSPSTVEIALNNLVSQDLIEFLDERTILVTPHGSELLSRAPLEMNQRGKMSLRRLERGLCRPVRLALSADAEDFLKGLFEHACSITRHAIALDSLWVPTLLSLVEQMCAWLNKATGKGGANFLFDNPAGDLDIRTQLLFADILAIATHFSSKRIGGEIVECNL